MVLPLIQSFHSQIHRSGGSYVKIIAHQPQVQVDAKGGFQLNGEGLAIYSKERREEGIRRESHCRALLVELAIYPLETGCKK